MTCRLVNMAATRSPSARTLNGLALKCCEPQAAPAARSDGVTLAVTNTTLMEPVLVPEPVAAATALVQRLRLRFPAGAALVVYDLGAGTFDGAVVARTGAGFEVVAVDGRDDVGGLHLDEALLAVVEQGCPADGWCELHSSGTVQHRRSVLAMRNEVREARERLSRMSSTTVRVPALGVEALVTREEFERRARPLIGRTVQLVADVVRLARVAEDRIAGIALVGGASRTPLVGTELHRAFKCPPITMEQPELVVADGSVLVEPQGLPRPGGRTARTGPSVPSRRAGGHAGRRAS